MDQTAAVVAEINVALGTDYEVVRRLTGGLQEGAFELKSKQARVVLKWNADPGWAPRVRRTAQLVAKARAVGYPTPEWLAVGITASGRGIVFGGWGEMWETVRRYDEATAELIAGYEGACRPYRDTALPPRTSSTATSTSATSSSTADELRA